LEKDGLDPMALELQHDRRLMRESPKRRGAIDYDRAITRREGLENLRYDLAHPVRHFALRHIGADVGYG
jgi:hypothetical protein